MKDNNLDQLRHSAAHLLAAAVLEIYPDAKLTIGPSIEEGFYYDFDFGKIKISEEDLSKIEKKMHSLIANWGEFKKIELSASEAKQRYSDNSYKQELIDEFEAEGQAITLYEVGKFSDLCMGGHIQNPKESLQHFKLLSIAGAYWRGDEKNKMLTRIYGTAYFSKEELDQHLVMLKEAKQRDHKILGPKLDLFSFSDLVGSGLALWSPKGTLMRDLLDDFVWQLRKKRGYQKVEIPHITKKDLYVTSGHWDKFQDELFKIKTREGHDFVMKPMNCPHHTQIYARKQHSYRELPQRYANTTMVYRDEQSGELSGLSRVRCITQDDAHVFCRKSQAKHEMLLIWDIVDEFYSAVGFDMWVRLSLSDPKEPGKYMGKKEDWGYSEEQLRLLAKERRVEVKEELGEAAFYGPKVDFMATDSLGREWQVATIQLDMNMPDNFNLFCINENGEKERIVMIHAAIMGSIERYMSILIEHFAGAFPLWLSPVQVKILTISENEIDYAKSLIAELEKAGIRAELDDSDKSLGKKIALAKEQKPPYVAIIGKKEVEEKKITLKNRKDEQSSYELSELIAKLQEEDRSKTLE